jgi:hypothetical protein
MAKVSNCCGASTIHWEYGLCPRCKEHCEFEDEEEFDEKLNDVNAALDLYGKLGEFFNPKTNQDTLDKITKNKKP